MNSPRLMVVLMIFDKFRKEDAELSTLYHIIISKKFLFKQKRNRMNTKHFYICKRARKKFCLFEEIF